MLELGSVGRQEMLQVVGTSDHIKGRRSIGGGREEEKRRNKTKQTKNKKDTGEGEGLASEGLTVFLPPRFFPMLARE